MPPDLTVHQRLNPAKDANFHFGVMELPMLSLYVQDFSLPAVTLGVAIQPTPLVDIKQPGDKLVYDDMTLSFLVDEHLVNYREINKWMMHLGYPRATSQYKKMDDGNTAYSRKQEMQCSILTNKMNFKQRIIFEGVFPISLSSLEFTVKSEGPMYLSAMVTFAYDFYHFGDEDTL